MQTRTFKTNLRCNGCVETLRPILNADPAIAKWDADVNSPDKLLRVTGDSATREHMEAKLSEAGYHVLDEVKAAVSLPMMQETPPAVSEPKPSYFPLLLILGYLLAVCGVIEWATGNFVFDRAMRHFMAGFFLVFSFFKLLNVSAFADSYAMYDLLAKHSRVYGLLYPFLELTLALAYIANVVPVATNSVTLVLMVFGTLGVLNSMRFKKKIRCACLGSVINLPVSFVTLTEDLLMALMAVIMLVMVLA